MSTSRRSSSWSACRSTSCCAGAPESSVHDGLRRRGAMGDREARTQAALVCRHTGAAEDAASRRPARPDGTSVIVNRALSPRLLRDPHVALCAGAALIVGAEAGYDQWTSDVWLF